MAATGSLTRLMAAFTVNEYHVFWGFCPRFAGAGHRIAWSEPIDRSMDSTPGMFQTVFGGIRFAGCVRLSFSRGGEAQCQMMCAG